MIWGLGHSKGVGLMGIVVSGVGDASVDVDNGVGLARGSTWAEISPRRPIG